MNSSFDKLKPLMFFNNFILAVALGLLLSAINSLFKGKSLNSVSYELFIGSFHFIAGLGVLLKKRWGLGLFKIFLYLLYICFPLGTMLAKQTFKYMDENELEQFFK